MAVVLPNPNDPDADLVGQMRDLLRPETDLEAVRRMVQTPDGRWRAYWWHISPTFHIWRFSVQIGWRGRRWN